MTAKLTVKWYSTVFEKIMAAYRHRRKRVVVASCRRNNVGPKSSLDVGLASSGDVASLRRNTVEPTSSPGGGLTSFGDVFSRRRNNVGPTSSPDGDVADPTLAQSKHVCWYVGSGEN